jgi:hypothetical protein
MTDDDLIERAEAALEDEKRHPQRPWAAQGHSWIAAAWRVIDLVPDLAAALKAARAENERLREIVGPDDPQIKPGWISEHAKDFL